MTRRLLLLAVLLACAHAALGLWFCFNGLLNADEAFYGLAAREVMQGKLPYRDFGFTQMPLVPYAKGVVMQVIGFGFFEQRLAAGFWAALTALVGGVWLAKRRGVAAGFWFAGMLVLSTGWMYNVHIGKTYAVTGFVALLLGIAVLSDSASWRRAAALGLLGVVCVGCRLPMAPLVAVVWLGFVLEQRSSRHALLALGAPLFAAGVLIGPFVLAAPENFVFWTIAFHQESVALRNFYVVPSELWALSPPLWLGLLAVGVLALRRRLEFSRPVLWLLAALVLALTANLMPRGGYAEYAAPLVPLGLLIVGWVSAPLAGAWALRAAGGALAATTLTWWLLPPPTDPDIYPQVRQSAAALRKVLPLDREFNGPATLLALETGHAVPARLLMTPFGLTTGNDERWAEEKHLATPAWLTARMQDPALSVYALTNQPRWNFGRAMPDFSFTPPAILQDWAQRLNRDFVSIDANGAFVIFVRRDGANESQRN